MKHTKLRIGCLLLVLVLLLGILPVTALADDTYVITGKLYFNGEAVMMDDGTSHYTKSISGSLGDTVNYESLQEWAVDLIDSLKNDGHVSATATVYKDGGKYDPETTYGEAGKLQNYVLVDVVTNYDVYFYTDYTSNPYFAKTVTYGGSVGAPDDPEKAGCSFVGWYDNNDVRFDPTAKITSTQYYYAKWEENDSPVEPSYDFNVSVTGPKSMYVDTSREVNVSVTGVPGSAELEGSLQVRVLSKPKYSNPELWIGTGWYSMRNVLNNGYIKSDYTVDDMTSDIFPMSLHVDDNGTYKFIFELCDSSGKVIASDTLTVEAYYDSPDYRVYIDAAKHGTVTVSKRYADKGDTVTIYATPDKGYKLDTLKVYDSKGNRVDIYTDSHGDYYFKMPNRSVTVYATFTEINYDHFTDVPKGSWYYDAVYYVYDHDIMDGIGNRTFNPYGDLSRAMIVTTLYRLEGEPTVRTSGTFRDVPYNTWYSDAVEWAAKEGIVKGYGKKTFGPSNSVTVEQLAAILQRYADYKGYDVDKTVQLYADAVVSQWAVKNVRWAAAEGLLRDGRSTNATLVATRAEIAYALYGFMTNVVE